MAYNTVHVSPLRDVQVMQMKFAYYDVHAAGNDYDRTSSMQDRITHKSSNLKCVAVFSGPTRLREHEVSANFRAVCIRLTKCSLFTILWIKGFWPVDVKHLYDASWEARHLKGHPSTKQRMHCNMQASSRCPRTPLNQMWEHKS